MNGTFSITDFGAVGNGVSECTEAIQKAIQACFESGGGTVLVPEGTYLFYPIRLMSNVSLHLEKGAVLLAGTEPERYPEIQPNRIWRTAYSMRNNRRYVIYAEGVENVGIAGEGTIDFQGKSFMIIEDREMPLLTTWKRKSPVMIPGRSLFFAGCRNLRLDGITLKDSAGWNVWMLDCEEIEVSNLKITTDMRIPNGDGLNLCNCRHARIHGCNLKCSDDTVIVRSLQEQLYRPAEAYDIEVWDCTLESSSSAFRIGFCHDGEIRDCLFRDIKVRRSFCGISIVVPRVLEDVVIADPPRYPDTPKPYPEIGQLRINNLCFRNISMAVETALLDIDLFPHSRVECVRNILLENVKAVCGGAPFINAPEEHVVSDIIFRNVELTVRPVPEHPGIGEHGEFKPMMFFQNAENVKFENLVIRKYQADELPHFHTEFE